MKTKILRNKLLFGLVFLILFLIFSVFIIVNLKREIRIQNYPLQATILEKFLASVSSILKIGPLKKIEVDLSSQKMKIFEDKKIVGEFLISTGAKTTPTPTGKFKVYNKSLMVYSGLAKCWLPFWVGFTSDGQYGFHEIPICTEGRKGLTEIGTPASIGCIRLGIENAEVFYKWVKIGTPIFIYKKEAQ